MKDIFLFSCYTGLAYADVLKLSRKEIMTGTTKQINKYSAGCQVFQNAHDFEQFMTLCEQHRKLYGNSFTYALVDFRSMRRVTIKRVVTALSVSTAMALGWMVFTD